MVRFLRLSSAVVALAMAIGTPAMATTTFNLHASNVVFDTPSPLFLGHTVMGTLQLDDSVLPGAGFGVAQISNFSFVFGGIPVTLADTQLPGGDLTAFGTRSADGTSLSFLDIRYDLPPSVASCSLICAGQIQIGTFDNSNFVAIDDFNADTTSLVQFDASFAVPEPASLPILAAGLLVLVAIRKRRIHLTLRAASIPQPIKRA